MSTLDVFIRVIVAAALGGAIGLEREIREHTAGFRTHILVAVGAAAFALASTYGLQGTDFDPNRISAQIVTGIGFLGAGAIIRYGVSVRGLTTAGSLWTVAAVGLLTAQGFYEASLITTGVVLVSLYLLRLVEDRFIYPIAGRPVGIRVQFRTSGYLPLTQLTSRLGEAHVTIQELAVGPGDSENSTIHLLLKLPRRLGTDRLLTIIADLDEVVSVTLD